jgi:hypothetical protein
MKGPVGFLRATAALLAIFSCMLIGFAQTPDDSARIARLVELAKLWAAVKYFHPYLAYRDDIDWDGALVRAIPKVNAARDRTGYAAAIQNLLNELGDPVTRVRDAPSAANSSSPAERQPTYRKNADGVLLVSMTNYADLQDFAGTREKLGALKKNSPTPVPLCLTSILERRLPNRNAGSPHSAWI